MIGRRVPSLSALGANGRLPAGIFAILLLCCAQPGIAQTLGRAPDDGISVWRVAGSLLLCVILAIAGAFVLKSRAGHSPFLYLTAPRKRRLQLVETLRLNPQVALAIVMCDGRELLVLSSERNARVLNALPWPAETPQRDAGP